jgi:hypothetical protein
MSSPCTNQYRHLLALFPVIDIFIFSRALVGALNGGKSGFTLLLVHILHNQFLSINSRQVPLLL